MDGWVYGCPRPENPMAREATGPGFCQIRRTLSTEAIAAPCEPTESAGKGPKSLARQAGRAPPTGSDGGLAGPCGMAALRALRVRHRYPLRRGVLAVAPPQWMTTSRLRRLVRRKREGWVGRWSGGHRWRAGPAKPAEVSQAHQHAAGVGAPACERTGSGGPRSTEGDGALNVGGPRYGRVGGGLTGHRPVLRRAGGGRPPSRGRRRPWTRAASTTPQSPSHHR